MLPGDELRLAGQGEAASDELAAGDLFLTIIIRSHPLFQLQGRDIHFSMPVSALALLAGGEIRLPAPGGQISGTLEAGSPAARDLRLAGKGFPGRGKHPAGDLVVHLQPVFPATLSARQRKLLRQANAALLDEAEATLPEIAAWNREHLRQLAGVAGNAASPLKLHAFLPVDRERRVHRAARCRLADSAT